MPGSDLIYNLIRRVSEAADKHPVLQKIFDSDTLVEEDLPYLKQFLNPDQTTLKPTTDRPVSLTVAAPGGWYKPDDYVVNELSQLKLKPGIIDQLQPGGIKRLDYENLGGLGNFTGSVGKDSHGKPYFSVYDKWDFESPVISPLVNEVMKRVGQPYNVYEKFDLAPMPTSDQNIELWQTLRRNSDAKR